jgi:two-component system, NtrC family, response regulator AtoC
MPETTVLVVDDDKSILTALKMTLEGAYAVCTAENGANALKLLRDKEPDVVLLDIGLPDTNGIELISQFKTLDPELVIIMVTAVEETRMVVKALKLGAYDYLVKPIDAQELKLTLKNALETRGLKDKIRRIQKPNTERYRFDLIGQTPQIKAMIATARKVASSPDTPLLITGETGTGKGVLARTIHFSFAELPGPFVSVNCSAITHDLFESELFGYDRGAFTGARSEGRIGRFEEAAGGTLFLDEIGSMSLSTQSKLLGVLDDRVFHRVGGSKSHCVSARIIAATNTDLQRAVEEGQFRRDLFFRLNVVSIRVPPLRERVDDIMPLTEYFIGFYNQKYGKKFSRVAPETRKALLDYPWPGNVRELRNMVERIILLESGSIMLPHHFASLQTEREAAALSGKDSSEGRLDYEETIKRLMQEALTRTSGNVLEAARLLNMPAHKMRYRIKKYGIKSG